MTIVFATMSAAGELIPLTTEYSTNSSIIKFAILSTDLRVFHTFNCMAVYNWNYENKKKLVYNNFLIIN